MGKCNYKQCPSLVKRRRVFSFIVADLETTFIINIIIIVFSISQAFADISEFEQIKGDWIRTDGGYIIQVKDIKPDQSVIAKYLNPRNINISEARISTWKGLTKLVIKLQDDGYPGSTYTLYYYGEKDALVGFYYQAEQKKTYEVIFMRQPGH